MSFKHSAFVASLLFVCGLTLAPPAWAAPASLGDALYPHRRGRRVVFSIQAPANARVHLFSRGLEAAKDLKRYCVRVSRSNSPRLASERNRTTYLPHGRLACQAAPATRSYARTAPPQPRCRRCWMAAS